MPKKTFYTLRLKVAKIQNSARPSPKANNTRHNENVIRPTKEHVHLCTDKFYSYFQKLEWIKIDVTM